MVICLERGADLHMAQLMPLPLTVSCSGKIQIGFTFLVLAYPGYPGNEAVKWLSLYWLERFSPGLLSGYFCKIALVARLVILIARYAQFTPPARHDKTVPSVSCWAV